MASTRRFADGFFKHVAPSVDVGYRPAPVRIADGLWSLDRRLRMPGGPLLPSRTTLVRGGRGGMIVISPPPAHDETFAAIDALGPVEALVAPNSFHHLYVGACHARYPDAAVYLAPGLQERIPALPKGVDLAQHSPAADLETATLGPVRGLSEVFLYHRPSRSLILADVAFHMVDFERAYDRVFWRVSGVPAHFGPSRTARFMLLKDRVAAATALRRALEWPFERVVVAHGTVLDRDARARFERGFAAYLRLEPV